MKTLSRYALKHRGRPLKTSPFSFDHVTQRGHRLARVYLASIRHVAGAFDDWRRPKYPEDLLAALRLQAACTASKQFDYEVLHWAEARGAQ